MAPPYKPLVIDVRMSDYGYWVVTVSVAPGLRMAVMVAKVGITSNEARDLILGASSALPHGRVMR